MFVNSVNIIIVLYILFFLITNLQLKLCMYGLLESIIILCMLIGIMINDNCMNYDCSKTDLDKLSLRSCHLLHGSFVLHGGH